MSYIQNILCVIGGAIWGLLGMSLQYRIGIDNPFSLVAYPIVVFIGFLFILGIDWGIVELARWYVKRAKND